jgi:hypothetical protein
MKRLYEFTLEGTEETILVEVEDNQEGPIRASSLTEKIKKASMSLEESLHNVKPAAEVVLKKLRGLSDPADEISIAFGLKLSADAGVILAASSIEANYTVTMSWHKEPKKQFQRSKKSAA